MDFLQAERYYVTGTSFYSGYMSSGPDKDKFFKGSIGVPLCVNPIGHTVISTLFFEDHYSGFLNLNNCLHDKVAGCLIASPVVDNSKAVQDSLFGYQYRINNTDYLTFSIASHVDHFKTSFGRFNGMKEGLWCFDIGYYSLGNVHISIVGDADLKGDPTYVGYYFLDYKRIVITSDSLIIRYGSRIYTNYRTSEHDSMQVINAYLAQVILNLDTAEEYTFPWSRISTIPGSGAHPPSVPSFSTLDMSLLFPLGDRNPKWSDLARDAYNSTAFFSGNGVALSGELLSLKASATDTGLLIKNLLGKNASMKIIAKLFLAFHYGWKLLASDCQSLSKEIKRYNSLLSTSSKCSANQHWSNGSSYYSAFYHCYYIRNYYLTSQLDKLVAMLDLELDMNNIWDLVPWSFVVDWFTNLSELAESCDSYHRMTQEHKIVCTGRSVKCVANLTGSMAGLRGWLGSVKISHYDREYTSHVIYPSLFLTENIQPLEHIVEGGALIVSKR